MIRRHHPSRYSLALGLMVWALCPALAQQPIPWATERFVQVILCPSVDAHFVANDGRRVDAKDTWTPAEMAEARAALTLWADQVADGSAGHCRLRLNVAVIDTPITDFPPIKTGYANETTYWPDPTALLKLAGPQAKSQVGYLAILVNTAGIPIGTLNGFSGESMIMASHKSRDAAAVAKTLTHEFIHCLDWGISLPEGFYNTVPLHEALLGAHIDLGTVLGGWLGRGGEHAAMTPAAWYAGVMAWTTGPPPIQLRRPLDGTLWDTPPEFAWSPSPGSGRLEIYDEDGPAEPIVSEPMAAVTWRPPADLLRLGHRYRWRLTNTEWPPQRPIESRTFRMGALAPPRIKLLEFDAVTVGPQPEAVGLRAIVDTDNTIARARADVQRPDGVVDQVDLLPSRPLVDEALWTGAYPTPANAAATEQSCLVRVWAEDQTGKRSPAVERRFALRPASVNNGTGLVGAYYADWRQPANPQLRADGQVRFAWSKDPTPGIPLATFGAVWDGWLVPPVSGRRSLAISTNGSASLYIDDRLHCEATSQGSKAATGHRALEMVAGRRYHLRLVYHATGREARVALLTSLDGDWLTPVPTSWLHAAEQLAGTPRQPALRVPMLGNPVLLARPGQVVPVLAKVFPAAMRSVAWLELVPENGKPPYRCSLSERGWDDDVDSIPLQARVVAPAQPGVYDIWAVAVDRACGVYRHPVGQLGVSPKG